MNQSPTTATPPRNCPLVHVSVAVLNDRNQLLLVQEEKPASRGKWNLPGGHMDAGEAIIPAAERELLEETTLRLNVSALLAVYSGPTAIRFVFLARSGTDQTPTAGHEILAVRYAPLDEILHSPDDQLVSPATLRDVARRLRDGAVTHPLTLFTHRA